MRYLIGIVLFMGVPAAIVAGFRANPQYWAAEALETGRLTEVMWHVDDGADVNFKYEDHTTLLHMAAVVDGAERLIADLLDTGADVHARIKSTGSTPLHLAAGWGHPRNVRVLLERGANRNEKDWQGRTPLDKAREGRAAAAGGADARLSNFDAVIEMLGR